MKAYEDKPTRVEERRILGVIEKYSALIREARKACETAWQQGSVVNRLQDLMMDDIERVIQDHGR